MSTDYNSLIYASKINSMISTYLQQWETISHIPGMLELNVPSHLQSFVIPHIQENEEFTEENMLELRKWAARKLAEYGI